jgi:hypothetical protein
VPADDGALPDSMARAREFAGDWNSKRTRIASDEFHQLKDRAAGLATKLRGRTIMSHVERLDEAISRTSSLLPHAELELVASWQRERARVQQRVQEAASQVENLILAFDDEEAIPARLPLRIDWLAHAPARALQEVNDLVQLGERAVDALTIHARDCVRDGRRGESMAAIREIGRALKRAAEVEAEQEAA